ncbi:MAG: hypothetical protein WDA23_10640 [Gemmobacter sp.]
MPRNDPPDAILDAMHRAVRAGDLAALAPLCDALETALDESPGRAMPDGLRARAERNLACLDAAARGLRAARRRVEEVTAAARGLDTYDAGGRRRPIRPEGTVLHRRA